MAWRELTDRQWEEVRKHLPERRPGPKGGRPPADDRQCFEAEGRGQGPALGVVAVAAALDGPGVGAGTEERGRLLLGDLAQGLAYALPGELADGVKREWQRERRCSDGNGLDRLHLGETSWSPAANWRGCFSSSTRGCAFRFSTTTNGTHPETGHYEPVFSSL